MAPNLVNLSAEILSIIFSRFCLHCTKDHDYDSPDGYFRASRDQQPGQPSWYSRDYRQPLYSMCLVSKRFTPVAQAILHHEFVQGYGDSWRSIEFSWEGRLVPFLRTVAARPDLAALVRRIYVNQGLFLPIIEHQAQIVLEEAVSASAVALRSPQVSHNLAAFQEMKNLASVPAGSKAAGPLVVSLLLALTPNLERLILQVGGPWVGIPAVALTSPSDFRPLANLKTLDVCQHSDRSLFHLGYHAGGILETVVDTGNLMALNLHMCNAIGHMEQGKLRNLRNLRITHSRLGEEDLRRLLDSCAEPGLKSFVYEAAYPRADRWSCSLEFTGRDHFQPSSAIRHLLPHKTTLESLHLDLRSQGHPAYHGGGPTDSGWYTTPFTSTTTLHDFPLLTHVFLSACSVCNSPKKTPYTDEDNDLLTRLLPPNIVSLCLAGSLGPVTPRLANALLCLAKTVAPRKRGRQQFTKLRGVKCDMAMAEWLDKRGVGAAFAAAGVEFGYETWPLSEAAFRVPAGDEDARQEEDPETLFEMYGGPLPDDDDDL